MYLSTLGAVLGLVALPASANFIQYYKTLVIERADPIVAPGQISAHTHHIVGGSGFKREGMTYADTQAGGCTTMAYPQDKSNYWVPQLYAKQGNNYTAVPLMYDDSKIYYQQRSDPQHPETILPFPFGLRMIAGDVARRSFSGYATDLAATAISYACIGNDADSNPPGKVNGTWYGFPKVKCPGGVRAQVYFPSCWDGQNLDSGDHKSHMSYYVEGSHPDVGHCNKPGSQHATHTISLFMEFKFDTPLFDNDWVGDQHPFLWASGDTTGYGFHGDYVMGWKDDGSFELAVKNCATDPDPEFGVCSAFGTSFQSDSIKDACKLAPTVQEDVIGPMTSLPGCNSPSGGPGPVEPVFPDSRCNKVAPQTGALSTKFTDVTSDGWSYLGCAIDDVNTRTLSSGGAGNSVETCIKSCSGSTYAGIEFGGQCYCGNTVAADRMPIAGVVGNCNMPCHDNATEICGGSNALSLYTKCTGGSCKNAIAGISTSVAARDTSLLSKRSHKHRRGVHHSAAES